MIRISQFGVALGALGFILTLMGLFPGVTGLRPGEGVGAVQFVVIWSGFALLILGGLIYVKYTYYPQSSSNLGQQIGVRLAWTGLIVTGMCGLADFLGFGSHIIPVSPEPVFGELQLIGVLGGFLLSALGVAVFALAGMSRS
ncbi:MAG: hypothetical protein IT320_26045 [Anaerolineae bacterium]|nr:hypothetical protein [Anaerolineae bacterium]